MNEFAWRRQMRDLAAPVAPRRDLWAGIEARLDDAPVARTPPARNGTPWLVAASLAAVSLIAIALSLPHTSTMAPTAGALPPQAVAPWKPQDPRLAGAAIELDAARLELEQALHQSPDSTSLQRLLRHNHQQLRDLRQLDRA